MAIITINGVAMPAPSSLSIGMADLDSPNTSRNELGILLRDRVHGGMYKVEMEFNVKTGAEIAIIEQNITKAKLTVSFLDTKGIITREMYVGDRKKVVDKYVEGNPNATRWTLSFNLIEY